MNTASRAEADFCSDTAARRSVSGRKIRAGAARPIRLSITPVCALGASAGLEEVQRLASMPRLR